MLESALAQGLFKLALLVVGLVVARIGLAWLDSSMKRLNALGTGNSLFADWYKKASSTDKAIYYAARIAAVFLAVAIAIG